MTLFRLSLVAVLATASFAHAQSSTSEADALFDKGKKLMAENKLAEACTAFEESQRLAASTTAMNLANCREKNDQLATAYDQFLQVAKQLEGKTDPGNKKLREVALQRAGALSPRLSKLTLIVPSASQVRGLQLQLDARTIEPAQWNQPLPLDGGMYKLIARAEDRVEWSTTIAISPSGDAKNIEVPTLTETNPREESRPHVARSSGGSLKLPLIFGVAALGLGGAALGFELWGRAIYSDAEDELFDRDRQVELWDQANTRHYMAQGAGIAAIGCAAAAVVFFVTRDKGDESPVAIAPVVSPTSAGLAAFASW